MHYPEGYRAERYERGRSNWQRERGIFEDSLTNIPAETSGKLPPVVVAGGFQTAIVLMRSLARRGVEVHVIDSNPRQPVFRTVYGKAHLCPNSDREPEAWISFMIRLAAELGGKPVLISSSDQYVSAIAAHATALEPHFTFCQTSIAAQALLATKKRQYSMAEELGLPVPVTRFVHSRIRPDSQPF